MLDMPLITVLKEVSKILEKGMGMIRVKNRSNDLQRGRKWTLWLGMPHYKMKRVHMDRKFRE